MTGGSRQAVHGLYTTPRPLVDYLVRSVHILLQTKLGLAAGLADPGVRLLDPAAGAMNFLRAAWRQAITAHLDGGGALRDLIQGHLLAHCTGIELLPDVHARGLAALGRFLRAAGCRAGPERLPAVLGDALEPAAEILARPFNVILGNPPWRGRSSHKGAWISGLLQSYFRVDGGPLGERNPKWLHDDYVKFLRLAQGLIDRNGEGIVAFVLNHNFLDAPTFRGLRRSLLDSFQEIYALDLHGNARRDGRRQDGEENVFSGVAQGAVLLLLVKKPGLCPRVLRADLRGGRGDKLRALGRSDVRTTAWTEIEPRAPAYLFVAGDRALEREYQRGMPLPEIFPVHGVGIVTGWDAVATALDRRTLERRLAGRRDLPRGWRASLVPFLARPFDLRHVLYADGFLARPRKAVMRHMLDGGNLGLIAARQSKEEPGALVTRWIAGHKVISACDVSSLFPLYLGAGEERRPNLAPGLAGSLGDLYGKAPEPEAILGYVYAVLYSGPWRRRYRELLRRSFPRISFPRDPRRFAVLAGLGRELIDLHLLQDPRLERAPPEIEPAVRDVRIGAYPVLAQWLRARSGRGLCGGERRELQRIAEALRLTLEVEARIVDLQDW